MTTRRTHNDLHTHITYLCTAVGVTDAPPNGVKLLLSTSVSDFLSDGVGGKVGRAEEKYVQTNLPPYGSRSVQKPAAAGGSRLTAQIFI